MRWTDEQWAQAQALRAAGNTTKQIADLMGLTRKQVGKKFEQKSAARIEKDKQRAALYRHTNVCDMPGPRVNPPDDVLRERDARMDASYRRTIGAQLMGDPPPGYSALDQHQ
jgi:rhamnose utilization protein RhaD (predicted bifunctional aldolase and dehydrogenase)